MDPLQIVSSAMQIVSSMVAAIGSIEQASRDLDDAAKRIRILEEFVSELENLVRRTSQKHAYKLQNSRLDLQIQSLNNLIDRLHPNITKARRVVSKSKVKNVARVLWNSMAGDPLGKILISIQYDLNWWLESQKLSMDVETVIEKTARTITNRLRVNADQGYPISHKCCFVREILEKDDSHRVVLIVGLSGIGKTCLARQVASDLPSKFIDGAVELRFGQWCSRAACDGDKVEYQKRLTRKLSKFLLQIGFHKEVQDENSIDLEYICYLLQEALYGKSILVLLDDVWEQDIVERFGKLYDNGCRYLVTTRNESVYEITEAEKVEMSKDDIMEISKAVLLHHTLLREDELSDVAETLLERCGHHPLTVAVMGKALRKETRAEKWEKAITNLSTYATCAPGPISYVNEKEAETTVTIFGSLEFSLEVMPEDSRRLFIALASLSWAEPLPEACLEAVWSILGQESLFPLTICKLVEGSLLMKTEANPVYQAHDMVSLYLNSKENDSVNMLLTNSTAENSAVISPWLYIFGKDTVKRVAEKKIEFSLSPLEENQAIVVLEAINQVFMNNISISEFEASRASFSRILGPKIGDLMSAASHRLVAVSAKAIINIFTKADFSNYLPCLETIGAVDNLAGILEESNDPETQINISNVLAKLAEFGNPGTISKVLQRIPLSQLGDLLSPQAEEWHDSVFTTLMSLIKAGKSKAVEKMLTSEVDKNLIRLLENGSDVSQHHAFVILKSFYEFGGPSVNRSLGPGSLKLLPWQARIRLEKFVLSDQDSLPSPKPHTFDDIVCQMMEANDERILEAMQNVVPLVENAGNPRIRDMILKSTLIKRLSELLRGQQEQHFLKIESAFVLMKLACSGGESIIRKILEYDVVQELVKIMQRDIPELQDSAYTTLHQMLFAQGGVVVILNQLLRTGQLDRLINLIDSKSAKTREVSLNCVLDIVEVGSKTCLEQLFSLQVVEKLARIEKAHGGSGETLVGFLKGISKCKHLTTADRWVMKQQVVRKARAALKGHKFEARVMAAIDAFLSEGSKGARSSRIYRRKQ